MAKSQIRRSAEFGFMLLSVIGLFFITPVEISGSDRTREIISQKLDPIISAPTERLLDRSEKDGLVTVWVFFTDKGVRTQHELAAAADKYRTAITSRAAQRRTKTGITGPTFFDLPVVQSYVSTAQNLGGKLRSVSRWLNAASFTIERSRLQDLAALPFVREIRSVAKYRMPRDEMTEETLPKTGGVALPGPYDYGTSAGQLAMINVGLAHNDGYDGSGILVCMIDTGFRKDHDAFAAAYAEGRVLAEHDFIFDDDDVQNEIEDIASQHNHGTSTWSVLGGEVEGQLYGPAFKASFILAKTEDMRGETAVEEDYWVEAAEWAESFGADIISSSLGYTDWYDPEDFDGNTCVTTVAADIAASLGVVVCVSAGNYGPNPSTLLAPADADSILAVGAVYNTELITSFSSRGPTYDARTKPEVCAQGSDCWVASANTTNSFGYGSGTSYACPLVAGAAALVLQAHPGWTPMQVREALMQSGDHAAAPDNAYGWGIIDVMAAINYSFPCECGTFCDLNDDELITPVDLAYLVNFVYRGYEAPALLGDCPRPNGDWDCSGGITPMDVILMINFVYRSFGGACDPCAE
jgi:subtilisin family serine protease